MSLLALPPRQYIDLPETQTRTPIPDICALPTELVERIAAELELSDLCFVRLTCKDLSRKTIHNFGATYFTQVQTNLSSKSLQKLEQLSHHADLRSYVRTLLIRSPENIGRGLSWPREGPILPRPILPPPDVRILCDALLALENCRSFYLSHNVGNPKLEDDCLRPWEPLKIILHIIAEARLPVKSFTAGSTEYLPRKFDTNRVHLASYQRPEFKIAWSHLQNLSFRQQISGLEIGWIRDLIIAATNLRCLTLAFSSESSNQFFGLMAPCEVLPRLQELNISSVNFHNDGFFEFLFRFKDSLRVLRLAHVCLDSRTWKEAFRLFKTELPALETISVCYIQQRLWLNVQGGRAKHWGFVHFPTLPVNPSASEIDRPNLHWLDGWKMVDLEEFQGCDVSRILSQDPNILKYPKCLVVVEVLSRPSVEHVRGLSYTGANIGDLFDMLAEVVEYEL
jgi:hypothetical protein